MTTRMRMMTMWTKYDYLCVDCDALIEITACVDPFTEPSCICDGEGIVILLSESDGNAPILTDVSKVTPRTVVKIDSNPYN
jgi:hypothetical protein